MSLLHRNELPRSHAAKFEVIHWVGIRVWGPVEHVRAEQAVFIGESVVDTGRNEVLVNNLVTSETEDGEVWIRCRAAVGQGVKCQVLLGRGIHCELWDRITVRVMDEPVASVQCRHVINLRDALRLPDAFVVCEEERAVPEDRSPNVAAELVPLERRNRARVEEISGVQRAIPEELVRPPWS